MARRWFAISLATWLWVLGGLSLLVSAAFLFTAIVHHAGSDGWLTSMVLAAVFAAVGASAGATGAWLVTSGWFDREEHAEPDDEAMWRT